MFMPGVWIILSKKKIVIIFQKENGNTFASSKIAQIYYYDPQSARINLQSPQGDSTPWTLTLVSKPISLKRQTEANLGRQCGSNLP